jgi:DNA-binding transcriptional ArsR family regulator
VPTDNEDKRENALFHPLRARIVAALAETPSSATRLAPQLEISVSAASYQFSVLQTLGLIELVETRRVRGAYEKFYGVSSLAAKLSDGRSIAEAASVHGALADAHTRAWAAAVRGGFDRPDALIERRTPRLDEKGFAAVERAAQGFLDRLRAIEDQAGQRIAAGKSRDLDVREVDVIVLGYESVTLTGKSAHLRTRRP